MSTNGIRHFLDLIDVPGNELRGIIANSRAMKSSSGSVAKPLAWAPFPAAPKRYPLPLRCARDWCAPMGVRIRRYGSRKAMAAGAMWWKPRRKVRVMRSRWLPTRCVGEFLQKPLWIASLINALAASLTGMILHRRAASAPR